MSPSAGTRRRAYRSVATSLAVFMVATAVATPASAQSAHWWHATWQMPDVWQVTDGTGVTVAVIDSGVDASISELAGAVVTGVDLTGQGGDGMIDHDEDAGHGTAMAALIASRGGDSELTGVAPGATVLPIAVGVDLGGEGATDRYPAAIREAVDRGAQLINMSLAVLNIANAASCPEPVAEAVRYAVSRDVVVVAGTGNTAGGASEFPGSCPGVLTVGAVDQALEPWQDSHRSEHVDVAAPGTEISLVARGGVIGSGSGTSSSTALVSGVVALIRAEYPELSAREVVARLLATVEDIAEPGRDDATGYGLVRPYQALTEPVPPDAPNPVHDALGDLSDVDGPTTAPATGPPLAAEPVLRSDDDGSGNAIVVVLAAVGALVIIAAVVVILLLVLRSRRRPPGYPTGQPPPPPGYPSPPPR